MPPISKGVLIAVDNQLEWMLPWWWHHYRHTNSAPVCCIDLGLSSSMQKWVEKRATLIPFTAASFSFSSSLLETWEQNYFGNVAAQRQVWWKKPFALALTPFSQTIWLDIDCEVKKDLEPLFHYKFALCKETEASRARAINLGLIEKNALLCNSGVIAFEKNHPLIQKWCSHIATHYSYHMGDQEVLSAMLTKEKIEITFLPQIYNWRKISVIPEDVAIIHHVSLAGKRNILAMLMELMLLKSGEAFEST